MESHEGNPGKESPRVRLLEPLDDDVEGAPPSEIQHLLSQRTGPGPGLNLGRGPRRVFPFIVHDRGHKLPIREQLPVRAGVRSGEAGEFVAGAVEVSPHGQAAAVEERHGEDRVRVQVREPVPVEPELVVTHQRVALNQVVRGRAGIMDKARQGQLLRARIAPDPGGALEHEHLEAGPGSVGRGEEAVVSSPGDHDVVRVHAVAPR